MNKTITRIKHNLLFSIFILFYSMTFSQEVILTTGEYFETKNELKPNIDGWFKTYYDDQKTELKISGYFSKSKKNKEWKYYSNYKSRLDSIVEYLNDKKINKKIFSKGEPQYLQQYIEYSNDSTTYTYYYHGCVFYEDSLKINNCKQSVNVKNHLNKSSTLTYFKENGIIIKELFSDSTNDNTLIKSYYKNGNLMYHKKRLTDKDYEIEMFYENKKMFKYEEYKDDKLYNVKAFDKNGNNVNLGTFKNGSGVLNKYRSYGGFSGGKTIYKNGIVIKAQK